MKRGFSFSARQKFNFFDCSINLDCSFIEAGGLGPGFGSGPRPHGLDMDVNQLNGVNLWMKFFNGSRKNPV